MSSNVRLLYNPDCTKCRLSKELLERQGETAEVVEYLINPPSRDELEQILTMLGLAPRALMRRHEPPYHELNLDKPELSHEQLIAAMIAHPILIERPIVIKDNKAVIGRPPERILDIL